MRVLVVDQDSASNEAIARSLRDLFTVDAVTNKGDCLDLLRSNTFEVIVAAERLADGSGLELLGQISKKWPSVLRIFAADRQRLQLLRGRLGPFQLFQTLAYPIDPERLIATLSLAAAAEEADADPSSMQHVVLGGEPLEPQEADSAAARGGPASRGGPAPRVGSAFGGGPASRGGPAPRAGSAFGGGPAPRGGAASSGGSGFRSGRATSRATASQSVGRGAAAPRSPVLVGSGTLRQGRAGGASKKASRVRFPPLERSVRLEQTSDTSTHRSAGRQANSFAKTKAMARAARSNFESAPEFDAKRLAVMLGGGAAVVLSVVVLGVKLLGSKSEPPPPAAPVVVHAPQYPQEVTDLIAQTESALKADDFKSARADVAKLRQLAPSHPRLMFLEGLLAQQVNASKGHNSVAAAAAGTKKHDRQSSKRSGSKRVLDEGGTAASAAPSLPPSSVSRTSADPDAAATSAAPARAAAASSSAPAQAAPAASLTPAPPAAGSSSAPAQAAPATSLTPAPPAAASSSAPAEAPGPASSTPGQTAAVASLARAPAGAASSAVPAEAAPPAASSTPDQATATASPVPSQAVAPTGASRLASATATGAGAAVPAAAQSQASAPAPSSRPSSGEPPPVIREAKLIRRVIPDYPTAARKEGIAGFVDLEVSVSTRGVVDDVAVLRATPPGMFDKSAVAAVRKWKYDPRFVDGLPTAAHLKVHLDFRPDR